MEMARKALVTALSITLLLFVAAPSMANFFGPGFGLNGLPSGWGPSSLSLAAPLGGTLVGSGVIGAGIPPFGVGTLPSAAIAGPSYAGSPGVFCGGFLPFGFGAPIPVPVPQIVPAAIPAAVPVPAPVCAPAAAVPACGIGAPAAGVPTGLTK